MIVIKYLAIYLIALGANIVAQGAYTLNVGGISCVFFLLFGICFQFWLGIKLTVLVYREANERYEANNLLNEQGDLMDPAVVGLMEEDEIRSYYGLLTKK